MTRTRGDFGGGGPPDREGEGFEVVRFREEEEGGVGGARVSLRRVIKKSDKHKNGWSRERRASHRLLVFVSLSGVDLVERDVDFEGDLSAC